MIGHSNMKKILLNFWRYHYVYGRKETFLQDFLVINDKFNYDYNALSIEQEKDSETDDYKTINTNLKLR